MPNSRSLTGQGNVHIQSSAWCQPNGSFPFGAAQLTLLQRGRKNQVELQRGPSVPTPEGEPLAQRNWSSSQHAWWSTSSLNCQLSAHPRIKKISEGILNCFVDLIRYFYTHHSSQNYGIPVVLNKQNFSVA